MKSLAPIPPEELPANRLMESSAEYLTDSELLSLILRNGSVPSALSLGRMLLSHYGSLKALSGASPRELMNTKGMGMALACAVVAALELAKRTTAYTDIDRPKLGSPVDAASYFHPLFVGKQQEEFHIVLLNTKNCLLRSEKITIGLLDRSQIHAREVFRPAIRESSSRLILIHNHPSGDPTPSGPDIACTKELVSAGKIIGIEVMDHVIIGQRTLARPKYWLSFREEGLL